MKIKICKNFLQQAIGLMFSRKKICIMKFKKDVKKAIHTFFVFFPIKVYFLDKNRKVVDKVFMKPFSIFIVRKKYRYVIEIPEGVKVNIKEVIKKI